MPLSTWRQSPVVQVSSVQVDPSSVHWVPSGALLHTLPQAFARLQTEQTTAVQPLPAQQVPPQPSAAPQVVPEHVGMQTQLSVLSLQLCPATHGEPLPEQAPDVQVSVAVQNRPSLHGVPFGWKPSAGHAGDVPLQCSATSQAEAAARQIVAAGAKPSDGQAADAPVQLSATSHGPALVRHTVPDSLKVQVAVQQAPPSHCSPASTTPLPHTEPPDRTAVIRR